MVCYKKRQRSNKNKGATMKTKQKVEKFECRDVNGKRMPMPSTARGLIIALQMGCISKKKQ